MYTPNDTPNDTEFLLGYNIIRNAISTVACCCDSRKIYSNHLGLSFPFQISKRKKEFFFRFSFYKFANEKRISFSFFVFISEVRKAKNKFVRKFLIEKGIRLSFFVRNFEKEKD